MAALIASMDRTMTAFTSSARLPKWWSTVGCETPASAATSVPTDAGRPGDDETLLGRVEDDLPRRSGTEAPSSLGLGTSGFPMHPGE